MTCKIAQLHSPSGRKRFLYKDGSNTVLIMHFGADGYYIGSRSPNKLTARELWDSLAKQGWKRLHDDPGDGIFPPVDPRDATKC